MSMRFKNFLAASRKRNMIPFGMFPADRDLSWIEDNSPLPSVDDIVFSATPAIEVSTGQARIILTADVTSSTFVYMGTDDIPENTIFCLQVLQDNTGGWDFVFPDNVRTQVSMNVSTDPNVMTTLFFQYRDAEWDFFAIPVEGPVV